MNYELELMRMRNNAGETMQVAQCSMALPRDKCSHSPLQHAVILEVVVFLTTTKTNSRSPIMIHLTTKCRTP